MADPKGLFKCQESAQVPISAHFSDDELAAYEAFAAKSGFESDQHWRLSPCETNSDCPKTAATGRKASVSRGRTIRKLISTRTMQRAPSRRPPSAASSLARCPRLACACQPEGRRDCYCNRDSSGEASCHGGSAVAHQKAVPRWQRKIRMRGAREVGRAWRRDGGS